MCRNLTMNRTVVFKTKLFSRYWSTFNRWSTATKLTTLRSTPNFMRCIQSCGKKCQIPKTPDIIYMPNIFRWMKLKLRFQYLKRIWDPEFSEGAFIYGSTRAVCKITEIISSGRSEDLNNLMTVSARMKLQDDINHRLTPDQKKLILLKPEDIKIFLPITVTLSKDGPKKLCNVNLKMIALKWHEVTPKSYKLALVALQTEFLRNYTENVSPEWSISAFNIIECGLLPEIDATKSSNQ